MKELDKNFRFIELLYVTVTQVRAHTHTHEYYLSDASMSPLSMFSIASLRASQPSSPRQLPVNKSNFHLLYHNFQIHSYIFTTFNNFPRKLHSLETNSITFPGLSWPGKPSRKSYFNRDSETTAVVRVRTIQIHLLHMRFVHDSLSHHQSCCLGDLPE